MQDRDNKVFFAAEPASEHAASAERKVWRVLIVDDDSEIHAVTKLALSGVTIDNRSLQFLHAYSGAEAIHMLSTEHDIALILLDVVMETDDAGLQVARQIREELNNDEVRIVLRTGQPGYAPEEEVILNYDINDYKTKTDLTRGKLMTTVISSIRSYQQIRTINESRRGLEKIVNAAANLMERHSIHNFAEGVVTQLASLLGLNPEGLLCVRQASDSDEIVVLGAAGHYARDIQAPLQTISDGRIIEQVKRCFSEGKHLFLDTASVFYIDAKGIKAAAFIDSSQRLSDVNHRLVELFLANISVGFENVTLFEELRTAAYKDSLTGHANRAEFIRHLDNAVLAKDQDFVIAITDISHFSDVNDALGQDVGNKLIQAVGQRLQAHLSGDAVVARISADVFGVLARSHEIAPDTLREAFFAPFTVDEHRIPVMMTTGFSRCYKAVNGLDLLKQAYIALKNAKNHRLESFANYHPSMQAETERRLELIRNLRIAHQQRKLELWYQPQIELASGRMVGVEALLRWPQPDGSFIAPDIFIPLAEYSGLILEIGHWVLEESCRTMRDIDASVCSDFRMAVNVSVPQFRQKNFAEEILNIMQGFEVPPQRLEIEITESIVMDDPNLVAKVLSDLKSHGVRIAIDDFGVGFSSLSYVQRLPLDKLKIDRAFVRSAHTDSGAVIIETIINMGHRLGLQTLAEGIETDAQAAYFGELRVSQAQGYLYARPMNLDSLKRYIDLHPCREEGENLVNS
ncbi:MAG: EAL domain-containing protein [Idiomarina sp.]|nr:EAL domain-containing protein [Idiomarina sp.]